MELAKCKLKFGKVNERLSERRGKTKRIHRGRIGGRLNAAIWPTPMLPVVGKNSQTCQRSRRSDEIAAVGESGHWVKRVEIACCASKWAKTKSGIGP